MPFVAFGFVDNTVLIHMGDVIDTTFGLYFGLPTLAAAAMGQVFSDTTGVVFGSSIEALATRLGLPVPNLSVAQVPPTPTRTRQRSTSAPVRSRTAFDRRRVE